MVLVGSLMVLCSGTKAGVAWWTVEQACKSNDGRTNLCANQQPCHQKSRSRPVNRTTRSMHCGGDPINCTAYIHAHPEA